MALIQNHGARVTEYLLILGNRNIFDSSLYREFLTNPMLFDIHIDFRREPPRLLRLWARPPTLQLRGPVRSGGQLLRRRELWLHRPGVQVIIREGALKYNLQPLTTPGQGEIRFR